VDHPDPRAAGLDDPRLGQRGPQRRLVHVAVHREHGRSELLQLGEEPRRDDVARVQDQIRGAELLDARVGQDARPAREVRIRDDRE
jgi:hypothetical protein